MSSFIETRLFTKLVIEYLTDGEDVALQESLMRNPDVGPVIPGSGGIRKIRWAAHVSEERCGKYSDACIKPDS
jgi:hypothetical protein